MEKNAQTKSSICLLQDRLFIGAVGSWYWQGELFYFIFFLRKKI